MTRQTISKKAPGKARKPTPTTGHKLRTLARQAQAVGRTSARVADPVVQSIQKEEPKTLAKMALALLAPRLANYALRFAIRNPVVAVAGVILVALVANHESEPDAA